MEDLKKYLHLYLWCQVICEGKVCELYGVHRHYCVIDFPGHQMIKITDYEMIKLSLRPISAMTDQEQAELQLLKEKMESDDTHNSELEIYAALDNKCREWEIDVDGLIEAGLAISK